MASINKVILIGNLGADPEVRYMPSGGAVTSISIATTDTWKDKESGDKREKTEWHRVEFFGRLAEIVGEYLKKGSQLYVEGSLRTDKWQDKETGQDRYTTKIVGRQMQMLGSRGGGGSGGPPADFDSDMDQSAKPRAAKGAAGKSAAKPPEEDFDDDIPF